MRKKKPQKIMADLFGQHESAKKLTMSGWEIIFPENVWTLGLSQRSFF